LVLEANGEFHRRRIHADLGKDYAKSKLLIEIPKEVEEEPQHGSFDETQDTASRKNIFANIVKGADLYAAIGAHYMSDPSKPYVIPLLDRLMVATKLGIPAVMLGQGMGPINDLELQAKAKEVLPLLSLIAIRENLYAPKLLKAFGVDHSKIMVTGDDATEMAYEARRDKLGTGIGLGFRITSYTEINKAQFEELKAIMQQAANLYKAKLIGLPISQNNWEADTQMINLLMEGYSRKQTSWRKFETCNEVIRRVGDCRLVITGAFHPAVFALSQGIPAICIAGSALYAEKFIGLADQFGEGCLVILLSEEHWQERLLESIKTTWQSAEYFRPLLLNAAIFQIEKGKSAYNRVFELVESMKIAAHDQEIAQESV